MIPTAPIHRSRPSPAARVGIGGPKAPAGRLRVGQGLARYPDARALVAAVRAGRVAAGVRGALPAGAFIDALGADAPHVQRGALLEPRRGRGVVLGPVGVMEGRSAGARARFAQEAAALLLHAGLLTEDPLIAVMAQGRPEDAPRGAPVARSLAQGHEVARRLERQGLDAFEAGVLIEDVLAHADIVVAPDGAAGNLLFRTLHFIAGVPSYGALCTGTKLTLVDTSRGRTSFEQPIRLAAYLARRAARGH
jgi:predicted methyltransferase MtxX (methanogen marker protein 4)